MEGEAMRDRILDYLATTGMKAGHLAAALGVHINTMSRWMNGKADPEGATKLRLERVLDGVLVPKLKAGVWSLEPAPVESARAVLGQPSERMSDVHERVRAETGVNPRKVTRETGEQAVVVVAQLEDGRTYRETVTPRGTTSEIEEKSATTSLPEAKSTTDELTDAITPDIIALMFDAELRATKVGRGNQIENARTLNMKTDAEELEAVKAKAKELGVSMADFVRAAIRVALKLT